MSKYIQLAYRNGVYVPIRESPSLRRMRENICSLRMAIMRTGQRMYPDTHELSCLPPHIRRPTTQRERTYLRYRYLDFIPYEVRNENH